MNSNEMDIRVLNIVLGYIDLKTVVREAVQVTFFMCIYGLTQ